MIGSPGDSTLVFLAILSPAKIEGPALIEETDSTTVVLPGDRAAISSRGHLVIEIGG